MNRFVHFLFYNNTIPIMFGILFLGAGATFAASPAARESVVASETVLTAVDNSYLLSTTITDTTVGITITSVTEDTTSYYIEYSMSTLEALDGMWQPVVQTNILEVSKDSVVGRDLGLYVEEEIAEVHAAQVRLLEETQASERRAGVTPKVVTTTYSGLVGQFFDPNQEVFPQYDPRIDPAVGVPLSASQERAHEVVRRLVEEARNQPTAQPDRAEERDDSPADPTETSTSTPLTSQPDGGLSPSTTTPPAAEVVPEPEPSESAEITS